MKHEILPLQGTRTPKLPHQVGNIILIVEAALKCSFYKTKSRFQLSRLNQKQEITISKTKI